MKTKKILSLVLAMVMALALAIPAFAATVAAGTVYELDASGIALTSSGNDGNYDTVEIDSKSVTLTGGDVASSATMTAAAVAAWVADSTVSSAYTNWTVGSTGTKVTFTADDATADTTVLPTSATAQAAPPTPAPAGTTIGTLTDLATGSKTVITTETQVPTISVVIPNTGNAVLNPYKMTVKVKDGAIDNSNGTDASDQIISATQFIKSTSNVPLKVNVNAAGKPSTGVTMATKSVTDKITDKQVYMYLNTKVEADKAAAPTNVEFPAFAKTTAAVLSEAGGVLSGVELPAPTAGSNASYLAFRLEGDMTPAPTTAWAATDKVDVTLTFTFVASALAE